LKIKSKTEALETDKPFITAEERKDVTDRVEELQKWLE